MKLLTIFLRLFEPDSSLVITCHLKTDGVTDLTAEGIICALESTLKAHQLPFSNLMSFTSDTCNVVKGKRSGVIAKLCKLQPQIINIVVI